VGFLGLQEFREVAPKISRGLYDIRQKSIKVYPDVQTMFRQKLGGLATPLLFPRDAHQQPTPEFPNFSLRPPLLLL
jgi:hypothetical protein